MSETEIKLVPGRPNRGKFPISLMLGNEVVLTGQVNPHKDDDIKTFIKAASKKFPGLKRRSDELRTQLLQLAAPASTSSPRSPRSPEDHPYFESFGATYWLKPMGDGDVPVPLMNFCARIVADVVRDDGAERETAFEIEVTQGSRTQRLIIPAARFNAMNWPTEHLGAEAIVHPGQSVRDHARAAIQFLSARPIPRQTIYSHTGWRKLNPRNGGKGGSGGKPEWVYLHGGGAVGAPGFILGVRVELADALDWYTLPAPPLGENLKSAINASLRMMELAADMIVMPVFCAIWRAAMGASDFGIHLAGPTGAFKSELAALVQQHFGQELDARHLPGSWSSTDNALEGLLFSAKDAVTVVDDFAPCGGPHEVARWHQRADRIFRAQGNNSGRSRMRADGSLRPQRPPRGLVFSTGEEIPKGQSLRARVWITEVSKGDIDPRWLTLCQQDARTGLYASAMAGFVRFLAENYESVRASIRPQVERLRAEAAQSHLHCRTPEIVANLAHGLSTFLSFAQSAGAMTAEEADQLWQRGWAALGITGARQTGHQIANEPAQRFIELITSAIASGQAHLADPDGKTPEHAAAWGWRQVTTGTGAFARGDWQPHGTRIGWVDDDKVYLEPESSHRVAQSVAGASGDGLVVSARTLRKRMAEKGWLLREGQRDEHLVRRVLEGRILKVIHLAPGVLSPQTAISAIPAGDPDSDPDNGELPPESMEENPPMAVSSHEQNPPLESEADTASQPNGGKGGNGGKRQGEVPRNSASSMSDAMAPSDRGEGAR